MKNKFLTNVERAIFCFLFSHPAISADLSEIYDIAVRSDPVLSISKYTISASEESTKIAESALLPSVSVSSALEYSDEKSYGVTRDDNFDSQTASINLTQALFREDRNIALEQSEIAEDKARIEFEVAQDDLVLRVTQAYFDVLKAQDALQYIKEDIKAITKQLDQAEQRFEAGIIAITAVYEARATYDQTLSEKVLAENAVDNAWEVLSEIIGMQEISYLSVLGDRFIYPEPEPRNIDEWTELALNQNPQVIALQKDLEVAKKEISLQEAGDLPTLDLVASYEMERTDARSDSDTDTATIGVQLAWPLYSGGGVSAASSKARYDYQIASQRLEQQRRATRRQVRDAYRGIYSNISRINALKASIVSARSALEATEAGFTVGSRTIVDVLNSSRNLYSNINDLSQAKYDYIINTVRLRQAAGDLDLENLLAINQQLEAPVLK